MMELRWGASNSESFSFGFGERDGTVFLVVEEPVQQVSFLLQVVRNNDNAVLINPDNYLNKYLHCVLTYNYAFILTV